ncbi:MAG: hypothetical protein PHW13_01630 [Methylococcales bacterium]|nr:hypothetical protein [Methylococcales bacterium]
MLQNATPLVHAHTGGDFAHSDGIHLHEFEALRTASGHLALTMAGRSQDSKSCIVTVGSAIKPQQTALVSSPGCLGLAWLSVPVFARIIAFPPHIADFTAPVFVNHNSSRAPPLFFC